MPEKKRVRMRGVKHSSKKLEDELLERSRAIAENPGLLRPQCAGNCRKCVFDKIFKGVDSLQKIRNDPEALLKEANRFGGEEFVKAYAGTISLAAAGTVPLLATGRIGMDKISYAVRGGAGADKLIGCQYYTDPKIRLLLYNGIIKKNKLHLYSFGEEIVCSDAPNMPEDYLYDTFWESPYEFKDDGLDCGHKTSASLEISVKSLGQSIRICDSCAKNVSTLQYVISRIAAEDPMDDISVSVRHKYHTEGEEGIEKIAGDQLKEYMYGKLTDSSLIAAVKKSKLGNLMDGDSATYIIGSENYGSSLDDFAKALTGDERLIATVRKFLSENNRAVVVKNNKVAETVSALWDEDWKGLIEAHTDAATVGKMGDCSEAQPVATLEKAYGIFISADVVATLPEFKKPGTVTAIADKLAKAYKVGGASMVLDTLPSAGIKDGKTRSVGAAFVLASGGTEIPLKLSADEREFADYLKPFAKTLLGAVGEKYRDAMNTFLTASSSGEKV